MFTIIKCMFYYERSWENYIIIHGRQYKSESKNSEMTRYETGKELKSNKNHVNNEV